MNHCDDCGTPIAYYPNEIELIDDNPSTNFKTIYWEQRRFDLVKAVSQGLASIEERANNKMLAVLANEIADAIIEEYKKEK